MPRTRRKMALIFRPASRISRWTTLKWPRPQFLQMTSHLSNRFFRVRQTFQSPTDLSKCNIPLGVRRTLQQPSQKQTLKISLRNKVNTYVFEFSVIHLYSFIFCIFVLSTNLIREKASVHWEDVPLKQI